MSHTPQVRSLYRRILRELPLRPRGNKLSTPSPLQAQIRSSIAAAPPSSGPVETHLARLEQFVTYARAQRTYTTLLERYNPGMNMDEEDRVRLTARRVGMDLPVEHRE
ncbi:hypothetical protein ANO11243_058580 [Dothideomycetidae sp. 11243]|nr:hypothetical protein ANO11243_058580 [fungal sp. No.11243]